ncbi:hypothetical protein BDP81DRAFT_389576 [Colletotrichum phormii]|uniref:Uncharacterized protein n=1 Tax=Colletotrichum phormii TaxID=359342 RepID=A0AAJ0EKD9_9PEZI|nr:uncharacterized protein BDP81DRAFT_389576 [Colletotrichum phormii]KAK1654482.1 hypothetical protein BDP81DRAFT_389576 [Colletotrichum phormii]
MPSQIFVTEPHPTVAPNTYIYSGRGGFGNIRKAPQVLTPATGITTPLKPAGNGDATRRFYSGIGGAGNRHEASECLVRTFDEDFDRQEVRDRAAVGHVGIGGAGNVTRRVSDASSVHSGASDESASTSSLKSLKNRGGNFWRRVTKAN